MTQHPSRRTRCMTDLNFWLYLRFGKCFVSGVPRTLVSLVPTSLRASSASDYLEGGAKWRTVNNEKSGLTKPISNCTFDPTVKSTDLGGSSNPQICTACSVSTDLPDHSEWCVIILPRNSQLPAKGKEARPLTGCGHCIWLRTVTCAARVDSKIHLIWGIWKLKMSSKPEEFGRHPWLVCCSSNRPYKFKSVL